MPLFGRSKTKWTVKTVTASRGPNETMNVKISKTVSHDVVVPSYLTIGEKFKIKYRGDDECEVLNDDHVHEYIKERHRVSSHCKRLTRLFPPTTVSLRFKEGDGGYLVLSGMWDKETVKIVYDVVRGFYEAAELCTQGSSLFNGLRAHMFIPGQTHLIRTHKNEKSIYRSMGLSPFEPVGLSIMNVLMSLGFTIVSTCNGNEETNVLLTVPAALRVQAAPLKEDDTKGSPTCEPAGEMRTVTTISVDTKKASRPAVKPKPSYKVRQERKLARSLEKKARRVSDGAATKATEKESAEENVCTATTKGSWGPVCCNDDLNLVNYLAQGVGDDIYW